MRLLLAALALLLAAGAADAASLLPPGKNCFFDANGDPLAAGKVSFFIPSTTTPKSTWQNSAQTISNTNPVNLDSAGCAVIYGSGVYRQLVKDVLGNTIWDQLTTDPGVGGITQGGAAGGSGNAPTVGGGNFALIDGQMVSFVATVTNTGPMTLQVGSNPPLPFLKDSVVGPTAMAGGEVHAGNVINAVYASSDASFHLVALPAATAGPTAVIPVIPGGRLTIRSGSPVVVASILPVDSGVIYYTPFIGSTVPIWDGTLFRPVTFSEMPLVLDATPAHTGFHAANSNFDLFVILDGATPRLCSGPAWTDDTTRSATISYKFGILSNTLLMFCRWGSDSANSIQVAAGAATFVGTFRTLAAGFTSWVPTVIPTTAPPTEFAKLYVWNNYNRVGVRGIVLDTVGPYEPNSGTIRPANNGPNAPVTAVAGINNRISYVVGDVTDVVTAVYGHFVRTAAAAGQTCSFGLGFDSTTAYIAGAETLVEDDAGGVGRSYDTVTAILPAARGLHYAQALEGGNSANCTYAATASLQAVLRM